MGANSASISLAVPLPMRIALVSLAYFSTQVLAFQFPDSFGLVAAIWPAAGVALAALLLIPRRHWAPLLGCLFAAGLAANLTTHRPVIVSVGFMVANICETAASAWLITHWCGDQIRFARVREVLSLMAASILLNAVTALIGAGAARLALSSEFWSFYVTWWVADGLGLLLVTPLIVVWADSRQPLASLRWCGMVQAMVLLVLGCAVAWFSFGHEMTLGHVQVQPYLLLVFIIWSAFQYGLRSTVTLLGAFAMIAVGCTAAGLGHFPLGGSDAPARLLAVQVFLGVMGMTGLLLAAVVVEQRDTQLSLGESEARFQSFMRELPGGAFIQNSAGRYQFISLGMRELLGLRAQDQIGRPVAESLPSEEAQAVQASDEEMLATMTAASFEQALTVGGQRRIILIHKFPMAQPGRELLFGGIALDITKRKQAEEEMRWKTALLEAQLDATDEGILLVDKEGNRIIQNQRCVAMWKIPKHIVDNQDHNQQVEFVKNSAKDPDKFIERVNYLYGHPDEVAREEVEFKDGTLLDRYSAPIVAKDGICFGRIWVFRDITAQRRAETTLRESEAKFRELAENINDVFWISVPDMSKMIYISPAYEAIWGRLPGSLYKNPQEWHEAIHPEDRARVWACIQKLSVEVPSISIEFRVVRPDGTVRWIHDRGFLVRDASGKVVHTAGVAKDITERKRTEEALRVSLAEKTTLLQEVHHRVKNNLQIVSSLLNLQAGHVQDAAVLELLAVTRSRVGAMALLHENLYQSENLARLNLPEYVESLCAQLLRAAGPIHARIRLERHIEPETVSLGLDQAVPCGLLLNELVTNALKHAFPGERSGCIRVTLERATPQTARLTVADDGVGLPVTLDPSHTSSLGLQLVFLLTQQLHGTVNFERGQGTAVHILFPNSAEKETPHE